MNPKKNKDQRRPRPAYPELKPGQSALVRRLECGETKRFLPVDRKTGNSPTKPLSKSFVFTRASHTPASSSKHAPHVGVKEYGRQIARNPLAAVA